MDEVVDAEGVTVLIDPKASLFILGAVMDFEQDKLQSGFVFKKSQRKGPVRLRQVVPRLNAQAADQPS